MRNLVFIDSPWWRLTGLLLISWLVMTQLHEWGHIAAGLCSGGTLVDFDVWPWHLPYSFFEPDPYPLITLWAGPLLGIAIPMLAAAIIRSPSAWFVSHFCWIANGSYLALAWISGDRYLDTPKLLEHGASKWTIAFYCLITISVGYSGLKRSIRNTLKIKTSPESTSKL